MVTALLAAVATLGILTLIPGPDAALVTKTSISKGKEASFRITLGIVAGLLVWGFLTVAGLAALIAASDVAYTLVKWAGAMYLLVLGAQTLYHALRRPAVQPNAELPIKLSNEFKRGLFSNLLNPKIAIFYTSLLPQLVPPGYSQLTWLIILVLIHALMSFVWLIAYGNFIVKNSNVLERPKIKKAVESLSGLILIGFGVKVLVDR